MTDLLIAFVGGIAAHQSDRFVRNFVPPWDRLCRYVIGVLTIFVMFSISIRRMEPEPRRDAMLALSLASMGTGAGVVAAYFLDHVVIE